MSEESGLQFTVTNKATSSTNSFAPPVWNAASGFGSLGAEAYSDSNYQAPMLSEPKPEFVLEAQLSKRNMAELRQMVAQEVGKALAIPLHYEEMRQALSSVHDFLLRECGEYECDADWRRKRDELLCMAAWAIVTPVVE